MLKELSIENVAVIEKAVVQFEHGFNIMTGETGAGKSILIDSINAIMGNRISKDIIRTGSDKASIFAVFEDISEDIRNKLADAGYESDDQELILQRDISSDGRSRCRINGVPTTASTIRNICSSLITIHGQHDNMDLLDPSRHIDILDAYGDLIPLRDEYRKLYSEYTALQERLDSLSIDESYKTRQIDLLSYQINEIESANLRPGEDEELSEQRNILRNAEKLIGALQNTVNLISSSDSDTTAMDLLSEASGYMDSIAGISQDMETLAGRLSDIYYELESAASDIQYQLNSLDLDGGDLDSVEERLDVIYRLKKKYGQSIDEILEYCEKARNELETYETSDQEIARVTRLIEEKKAQLLEHGKTLSEERHKAFDDLSARVIDELTFLNMPNAVFNIKMERTGFTTKGIDQLEFLLSTNKGEDPKSLSKIASGGELSRIMLGIKNVLAEKDNIGTLIFDEIDSGVSGSGAQKIGLKLKQTALSHQVICVTHSAQIASFADQHLLVRKDSTNDKTYTSILPLSHEERIKEVARIISGDAVTDISLQNAEEMLSIAKNTFEKA